MDKSFVLRSKIVPCVSSVRIIDELEPTEGDLIVTDKRSLSLFQEGTFQASKGRLTIASWCCARICQRVRLLTVR